MTVIVIGKTQILVLEQLRHHKGWRLNCGWVWTTQAITKRHMEKLVAKGLATKDSGGNYKITALGEDYLSTNGMN